VPASQATTRPHRSPGERWPPRPDDRGKALIVPGTDCRPGGSEAAAKRGRHQQQRARRLERRGHDEQLTRRQGGGAGGRNARPKMIIPVGRRRGRPIQVGGEAGRGRSRRGEHESRKRSAPGQRWRVRHAKLGRSTDSATLTITCRRLTQDNAGAAHYEYGPNTGLGPRFCPASATGIVLVPVRFPSRRPARFSRY